jgi:hypothetical protein
MLIGHLEGESKSLNPQARGLMEELREAATGGPSARSTWVMGVVASLAPI